MHALNIFIWISTFFETLVVCPAAIVCGDTSDNVYAQIKEVIQEHSSPIIWTPAKDAL